MNEVCCVHTSGSRTCCLPVVARGWAKNGSTVNKLRVLQIQGWVTKVIGCLQCKVRTGG